MSKLKKICPFVAFFDPMPFYPLSRFWPFVVWTFVVWPCRLTLSRLTLCRWTYLIYLNNSFIWIYLNISKLNQSKICFANYLFASNCIRRWMRNECTRQDIWRMHTVYVIVMHRCIHSAHSEPLVKLIETKYIYEYKFRSIIFPPPHYIHSFAS